MLIYWRVNLITHFSQVLTSVFSCFSCLTLWGKHDIATKDVVKFEDATCKETPNPPTILAKWQLLLVDCEQVHLSHPEDLIKSQNLP